MEIEHIKKIIKNNLPTLAKKVKTASVAEHYYRNRNDITRTDKLDAHVEATDPAENLNPLRLANNRISHPWHRLLVNQKASYVMANPPTFDVGDRTLNDEISKLLGDAFPKIAKDLAVDASNAGIAWLHVWKDESHQNFFHYALVDAKQIVAVFSKKLDDNLLGVLRTYEDYNDIGDLITVYEYWSDTEVSVFSKKKNKTIEDIEEYPVFDLYDVSTSQVIGMTNTYRHDWGRVPFIPFRNSADELSDLALYKDLIDVYDKVYAGFVNDLDDVQQIIFVLTNYGGQEKQEFLTDLKEYKMIKVDDDGSGDKGGVDTIAVDIPTEARDKLLEITRESIFVNGQGVDPQKNIGQNNSGAALKYMYSLLELKASALETEFRQGFADLVRFILTYSGANADVEITQKWTRTGINNELEQADIIAKLASVTSKEAVAKANPLAENWEDELASLEKEEAEDLRMMQDYRPQVNTMKDGVTDE